MGWLEDVLASLQQGGAPAAFQPVAQASPFPPVVQPATPEEEAAAAAAAREAAGARMIRANQRRVNPFGVPDMGSAGVQLALEQGPAGTGVPVPMPAGAPDGSAFGSPAPFGAVPPSLVAAKSMTAPPPPPPPSGPVPGMVAPGTVPGMPAGPGAPPAAPPPPVTDVGAARRAPMGPPPQMPGAPEKPFAQKLADLAPALHGLAAGMTGQGWGLAAQTGQMQQALQQQQQQSNLTARALLARGAPAAEVEAAVRSPELLKAMISKYFETGKPLVVGQHVVRERPDGTLETLGDFSKGDKAPKVQEFKLSDGSIIQKQWNSDKERWDIIPGFDRPVPGERDRRMSITDIQKLAKEGGQLEQVRGFETTFKPDYAGWKSNVVGDLANQAGRNLPESVVGKTRAEAASWWQDYDRYKNVVRHGLYGASLTGNEQKAFLAADITPGMDPEQVRRNLATQKKLVEGSIRREGRALIGSTYDKGAVAKAYGLPESFFDEEAPATTAAPKRSGTIKIGNQSLGWSVN